MAELPKEILLIEDDDLDAEQVERLLARPDTLGTSYHVTVKTTVGAGLEALDSGGFDLVLLDLDLPDSGWRDTLDTFERRNDLPVVVFTGVDDAAMAVQALKRGLQDYLVKSQFTEEAIKRSIRYAMERIAVDAALRRANRELERSNEELQRFAAVASHDLREPLRTIAGFVELIDKRIGEELEDGDRKMFEFVKDGAARMRTLIDDLLAYARVQAQPLELEEIRLDALVEDVRRMLGAALEEKRGRISTSGSLPTVRAHRGLLRQVFQNLFANALKFSEREPVIRVEATATEDAWTISVRDNGIGFDPSHAEQIFEAFRREHTRTEFPGSGLGLSVCQRIVERHGGRIRAESEPGKGSTFHVTLPR